MKKESIFFSISLIFFISFVLIIVSFIVLNHDIQNRDRHYVSRMNFEAAKILMRDYRKHHGVNQEVVSELKKRGFEIIFDLYEINNLLDNKNFKKLHSFSTKGAKIVDYKLDKYYYMHIKSRRLEFILKNNNEIKNNQTLIAIIFIVILFSFIATYIATIRKLKPLKELQKKVKNFGEEEFDIECATDKKDEISLLANEFDASVKKLKKLKESRNIFIRNIMHELKTPIAKGRFLVELPQTGQNKEIMQKVFYRLESLIAEFASIEELISTKKNLDKKEYYLADIIDDAMDILMCEDDEVHQEYENIKINIDYKLFSIAVKNLLDNGIKYSSEKQVIIKTKQNSIIFENLGDRLKYPLESYFEPFFKGDDVKSNQSFGLGLYIVKHILDAHGYKLEYKYENSTSKFIIIF